MLGPVPHPTPNCLLAMAMLSCPLTLTIEARSAAASAAESTTNVPLCTAWDAVVLVFGGGFATANGWRCDGAALGSQGGGGGGGVVVVGFFGHRCLFVGLVAAIQVRLTLKKGARGAPWRRAGAPWLGTDGALARPRAP